MIASLGSAVKQEKFQRTWRRNLLAMTAESEVAGVNLDAEAAALIEFQQAYRASARILSTAREPSVADRGCIEVIVANRLSFNEIQVGRFLI